MLRFVLEGGAKVERNVLDASGSIEENTFMDQELTYNDPEKKFEQPERAKYLASGSELNPNDAERAKINRDYKWLGKTWKQMMKDYNAAMSCWRKETGGGSGSEEYFGSDEIGRGRPDENFANYGPWVGRKDYLACIYMLDKKAGWIFNVANEPAPAHTVLEDSN